MALPISFTSVPVTVYVTAVIAAVVVVPQVVQLRSADGAQLYVAAPVADNVCAELHVVVADAETTGSAFSTIVIMPVSEQPFTSTPVTT